ncbi:MAG TPA: methylated-DNA--[protein]-cysteine S-methyltransferase [Candidatus Methylacidiphilales bacterium]
MTYRSKWIASPVGRLRLIASGAGLAAILWEDDDPARVPLEAVAEDGADPVLDETERQLGEYFAGKRREFALPLAAEGTPFQKAVWDALSEIPYGETRSYGQIAARIGKPSSVRAVGAANGRNPISILVPCHRVIGADGKLTGFAGGLETKAALLARERGDSLML